MLPIADRWFTRHRVSDAITLLYEQHVHPFLRCNIWHVRGRDADLVVDTGLGLAPLRDAMADLLDKPVIAVASHIHYDHVGGLHEFAERLVHPAEAARMADYREFASLDRRDFPAAWHAALGGPDGGDLLVSALPAADALEHWAIRSTTATRTIDEGDVVDLGNRAFEVLHLPGHSPGSIGLWEAATGTLFSGDAIYDGELLDDLPDSDLTAYRRTMQRLRTLPVDVVHGGHEASFGRRRLWEIADAWLASRA